MDATSQTTSRERQTAARSELTSRTARWSRVLQMIAALAFTWGLIVSITGGFAFNVGTVRVASRHGTNAFLIASIVFVVSLVIISSAERRRLVVAYWNAFEA